MKKERRSFVYILASEKNGTIYIGVTSNLRRRIQEHKDKLVKGFTEEYDIDKLVYYEEWGTIGAAILREKQMKKWNRDWKIKLIEKENIKWSDLYENLF